MNNFKWFAQQFELRELNRLRKRFNKAVNRMEEMEYEIEHHQQLSEYNSLKQALKIIDRERNSIVVRLMIRQENHFKNNIKQVA